MSLFFVGIVFVRVSASRVSSKIERSFTQNWILYKVSESAKNIETIIGLKNVPIASYQDLKFTSTQLTEGSAVIREALQSRKVFPLAKDLSPTEKLHRLFVEKRVFDSALDFIQKGVEQRLLFDEAKKMGLAIEEFVSQEITNGEISVTPEEMTKDLESKGLEPSTVASDLRIRLKNALQDKKKAGIVSQYVREHLMTSAVQIFFQKPQLIIDEKGAWPVTVGPEDAKVQVDFFAHFNCPSCKPMVSHILANIESGSDIQMRYRFLLPHGNNVHRMIAESALCVADQGAEKFFAFHKNFAGNTGPFVEDEMDLAAKSTGVDFARFLQCRYNRQFQKVVQYHIDYAKYIGFESAPILLINKNPIQGPLDLEQLDRYLWRPKYLTRWQQFLKEVGSFFNSGKT